MSDGVPKSRVTLTYDTKQPEGREKPRELPFRLMVLGDVGGEKAIFKQGVAEKDLEQIPIQERKVRQLNGRNLGEVMRGFKIKLRGLPLDADEDGRTVDVLVDSMACFGPSDVLRLLTGQKEGDTVSSSLKKAWHDELSPGASDGGTENESVAAQLWKGDALLKFRWARREGLAGFQKSYQNSKTLRDALKALSVALEKQKDVKDDALKTQLQETEAVWKTTLSEMKTQIEAELTQRKVELPTPPKPDAAPPAPAGEE